MSTGITDPNRCTWCGGIHTGTCSLVKAYEYHPDGTLKRVEFHHGPPAHARPQLTVIADQRGK